MNLGHELLVNFLALIFSLASSGILYFFRPRVRLFWSYHVSWKHLHKREPSEERPTGILDFRGIWLKNLGRSNASKVDVTFNYEVFDLNIWPPRHFEIKNHGDGRQTYCLGDLAAGEEVQIWLVSFRDLPPVVLVRSTEIVGRYVETQFLIKSAGYVKSIIWVLVFLGLAFLIINLYRVALIIFANFFT